MHPPRARCSSRPAGEPRTEAGRPLSTFGLQELTEASRRADNAERLNALPSLEIDRASILEALAEGRAER